MTAVVLEGKKANYIPLYAIIDGVWKARHKITPYVCIHYAPAFGGIQNFGYSSIRSVEKLRSKAGNPLLVELSRYD